MIRFEKAPATPHDSEYDVFDGWIIGHAVRDGQEWYAEIDLERHGPYRTRREAAEKLREMADG